MKEKQNRTPAEQLAEALAIMKDIKRICALNSRVGYGEQMRVFNAMNALIDEVEGSE